jgi:translation initiation factor 3 subunit E
MLECGRAHLLMHGAWEFDFRMLAEKLNMNLDEAERWIVNLIRNARLDAKIDSAQGHVIMGTQYPSLYQQVIDKTKALGYRSFLMANTIARQEV